MRAIPAENLVGNSAIVDYLDALDHVLEGNAVLLGFVPGASACGPDEAKNLLLQVLGTRAFSEGMFEWDIIRGWWRYHDFDEMEEVSRHTGSWLEEAAAVNFRLISYKIYQTRLLWLLTQAPSPHRRHVPDDRARRLAGRWCKALFSQPTDWHFLTLTPTFLPSVKTRVPAGPGRRTMTTHPLAYFDETAADTATFATNGRTAYLLLTNGSGDPDDR